MQIDANFINDYFDCVGGIDTKQRLGPERACSQGWITLRAMRWAIYITTSTAALFGLPLIIWGGWECIIIGVVCIVFCFLYTTLFSKIALGDILVLLFFGLIPVSYTFLFQSPHTSILDIPSGVWYLAFAQGLVTDCLLLVNNFRDRETDTQVGKKTLVTIIGSRNTKILYAFIGIIGCIIAHRGISQITNLNSLHTCIIYLFLPIHFFILKKLHEINYGRQLNKVLGMSALSILTFSILIFISLTIK
jgi:1,4-dihydroxy-2-naphthoate octaprenyltransferase